MGVVGFILVAGGALTVWAGFQGVNVVDVVRSVLAGEGLPTTTPGAGSQPIGTGIGGALAGQDRTPGTSTDDKPATGGGSPMEAK